MKQKYNVKNIVIILFASKSIKTDFLFKKFYIFNNRTNVQFLKTK